MSDDSSLSPGWLDRASRALVGGSSPEMDPLSPFERISLGLGRLTNETPLLKHVGVTINRTLTYACARPVISRRVYTDGLDRLVDLDPDRGVVLVANHRSFFDMYAMMLCLFRLRAKWVERIYFPVRSNFFYDNPAGLVLNYVISGGAMYPPIFRDASRAALNQDAVDRTCRLLQEPGTLVGLHPEGTRGKGPDPYELLPAQPGVGQIVLHARPIVVPFFVYGLPNDMRSMIFDTYRKNARQDNPVIVAVGEELDYSEFATKKPRLALYKRCADKMNKVIKTLGEREREIRAACARGDISDDDPNWLVNGRRRD